MAKIKKNDEATEWKWTVWDRLDVQLGNVTLKDLLAHIEDEYGVEASRPLNSVAPS